MDVHPQSFSCEQGFITHDFFLDVNAVGFTYKICIRCGTVRITERYP